MINLSLSPEMAVGLRNLLNVAVQAGGMQAAEIALPIDAEIRRASALYEQDRVLAQAREIEASRTPKEAR